MDVFSFDEWWNCIEEAGLLQRAIKRSWMRGQTVFSQGEVYTDLVVLTEGLVKLYYDTADGKEWIKSFIVNRGVFGSRLSQALHRPSPFSACCLENSRTIHIPYPLFSKACVENRALAHATHSLSQWLGVRKEEREHDLLCLSAEDRYRKFISTEAALAARITQIDMARYLGITPVALSRIKNRTM
jgi:CRP-like cAMP-binding protein